MRTMIVAIIAKKKNNNNNSHNSLINACYIFFFCNISHDPPKEAFYCLNKQLIMSQIYNTNL